ncbi:hypothetical protein [Vibrio sp. St2]|uniref:hypothetical protein n=1 Tax=Vibrio sp. St2 TaxID=2853441 RepID=UPI00248DB235|nr:hypothetical protein [Vibrio sp. St2]
MSKVTFPVFRNDGRAIRLSEILSNIPYNDFVWSIIEFSGIGVAPDDLSMDDFEELIHGKSCGLIISWDNLKSLSEDFYQTFDCLIVGAKDIKNIQDFIEDESRINSCEVLLSVFDSTEWEVWARDSKLIERMMLDLA